MDPRAVTLEGKRVRLRPLAVDDADRLFELSAGDEAIWRLNPESEPDRDEMRRRTEFLVAATAAGTDVAFAQTLAATGEVIGQTTYMAIDRPNGSVEIGRTWLARPHRRTGANTESKYLLMRHAFDDLGANRVWWKTDALNETSRNAILRLGATFEGTLRHHMVTWSGRLRDTVVYSVIRPEWPAVRARLEDRLARRP
ncbi:MAG TPA: GNAT family protein [Candidatus Thermoplasmatota archaeon]|nr:GNAT family protein [Candidatus Thermoplasmatota archaeon]